MENFYLQEGGSEVWMARSIEVWLVLVAGQLSGYAARLVIPPQRGRLGGGQLKKYPIFR